LLKIVDQTAEKVESECYRIYLMMAISWPKYVAKRKRGKKKYPIYAGILYGTYNSSYAI
jgi:uncharacterized membrane protein (DUF4010 family)